MESSVTKLANFAVSELRDALVGSTKITGLPVMVAQTIYDLYNAKADANESYRKLYPLLIEQIGKEGRNSKNVNNILELMSKLPQKGVKRNQFKRKYIDSPLGWKLLPEDPDNFMGTYWHGGLY